MSILIVVGYEDIHKAEEVRVQLWKMQLEYLLDMEDAVVVTKDDKGKVKLHQAHNLAVAGAANGGFWGILIGTLFLNPLLGLAVGASAGAISGSVADIGINDEFMKKMGSTLAPSSSALFVLLRHALEAPEKVLEELKGSGGTVIQTSLSGEDEEKLQAALNA